MRVAFLGAPGAGKGTQARELAREWKVPHIATGDMLREEVAAGTPLGREAKRYMEQGVLVPDAVVVDMIGARLARADAAPGFILDGFPRTIAQADALGVLLQQRGRGLDAVLYFDVSEEELVRRMTGRRLCPQCGRTYHVVSAPPLVAGVCDVCGGALYQRDDDGEATVRRRLSVYDEQTAPLLAYYAARSLLRRVNGEGTVGAIRENLRAAVAAGAR